MNDIYKKSTDKEEPAIVSLAVQDATWALPPAEVGSSGFSVTIENSGLGDIEGPVSSEPSQTANIVGKVVRQGANMGFQYLEGANPELARKLKSVGTPVLNALESRGYTIEKIVDNVADRLSRKGYADGAKITNSAQLPYNVAPASVSDSVIDAEFQEILDSAEGIEILSSTDPAGVPLALYVPKLYVTKTMARMRERYAIAFARKMVRKMNVDYATLVALRTLLSLDSEVEAFVLDEVYNTSMGEWFSDLPELARNVRYS